MSALVALSTAALVGCAPTSDGASTSPSPSASTPESPAGSLEASLNSLESEFDARVGVSAIEVGSGRAARYREDERFGYASTLKVFAAAELLRVVPAAARTERVTWTQADVDRAGYSPVTGGYIAEGLTLAELAEAAVRESDNTALNLILKRIGGPDGVDAALELLGDDTTEVVNYEPELNDILPGETADTTTPEAFTTALIELLRGNVLPEGDRAILIEWMSGNATGDALVRAGAPAGWTVADKSGGAGPIRNDIAVVTTPAGASIVITVMTVRNDPDAEYDDALVARAAAVVLDAFR